MSLLFNSSLLLTFLIYLYIRVLEESQVFTKTQNTIPYFPRFVFAKKEKKNVI